MNDEERRSNPTAEANVFCVSPTGFKTHFKLTFPEAAGVTVGLKNLNNLIEALSGAGYKPDSMGAGAVAVAAAPAAQPAPLPKGGGGLRQVNRQPSNQGIFCEFCDGPVYDNTAPGAKRNPKAPDYKCKDKECGGAAWIRDDGTLAWKEGQ